MSTTDSDEALMLAYGQGKAKAFDILYLRHKGGLYRYFLRQCGDGAVAEELYQDVWMSVIRSRERYEVRAKFTTWLYRLAHNRLIDHYRRYANRVALSFDDETSGAEEVTAQAHDEPENQLLRQRQVQVISDLIAQLPEVQREAFLLKEEAGLSLEEIAEATGVKREAAKSRLRYAVAKLRQGLQNTGE